MKKLLLFILFCLSCLMFCGCEKPIDPFKPPPRGFYTGTFQIGFFPVNDSSFILLQNIIWTFTEMKFWCQIDTLNLIDTIIMCDFAGNYSLNDSAFVFSDIIMSSGECDSNLTARGSFEFSRIINPAGIDSLLLYQHSEDSTEVVEKTINLVRLAE